MVLVLYTEKSGALGYNQWKWPEITVQIVLCTVTVAGVQTIAQKPNEAKCTGYSSTGGSNWRYRERSLYICRLFWLVSRYSSIQNSLCSYFSSHSTASKFRKFECSDYTFGAINSHGCCQITLFEIALFIVAIVQSSLFSTDWEKTEVF